MYFQVKKGFFILNCKLRRQGLHELKVLGKNYIKNMGVHFFQWQINITAIITAGGSGHGGCGSGCRV
jgi:hypothetical protein